ncbi:CAAX amino protease [Enterococcus florum]|uniref:CAAX amino protease n=1 Tax=Enterococcus florum TaxID=2480627 RepID=A0A4P5PEX2_9ENTE|nr:type II CAAX endopeptidase family protein [Enterococcus florum]GCF95254.1 CAAX amino protease [Enterococcus florum]
MTIKKYSFFTILTYGFILISPILLQPLLGNDPQQVIQVSTYSFIVGAAVLAVYHWKSRSLSIEHVQRGVLPSALFGVAGIPMSMVLQLLLLQIEQRISNQPLVSENTQNIVQLILENSIFIIATTIAGPIMEEFVFRRAIFGALRERFGFIVPALISSILFAFAHQDGHYLLYGGLGFFFCGLYVLTGRIWTSMIAHVGMNLVVILAQLAVHQM